MACARSSLLRVEQDEGIWRTPYSFSISLSSLSQPEAFGTSLSDSRL